MALRRRSYGHQHRPDWEQRLCRVDVALAEGELSPAQARERYRAIGRAHAGDPSDDEDADAPDGDRSDAGDPSPLP